MISNIYILGICYSILIQFVHSLKVYDSSRDPSKCSRIAFVVERQATFTCSLASHSLKSMVT